jgi:hypothetical protein
MDAHQRKVLETAADAAVERRLKAYSGDTADRMEQQPQARTPKRGNSEWRPTVAEILFAVVIAIIPWSFPAMGVTTRCILWLAAWCIFLHLVFVLIPALSHLPTAMKIFIAIGLTAFGSAAAYAPLVDMWREEMAGVATGRLRPQPTGRSDVLFQIGPNAKATFTWTGKLDEMKWGNMRNFVSIKRGPSGQLMTNTVIRDHNGNILVEITDNEWRVANASWEKNYADDALEVKDARGRIVFQIKLLPDKAEFQAEWWDEYGHGIRLVQVPDPGSSPADKRGFVIVSMTPDHHPDEPTIQPLFRYPSKKYFGQLIQDAP